MTIPKAVVEAVHDRADGHCEGCGWPLTGRRGVDGDALHHRVGGSGRRAFETPAGLVLLHGPCHRWVHAHPAQARDLGLIIARGLVDQGVTPEDVAVVRFAGMAS